MKKVLVRSLPVLAGLFLGSSAFVSASESPMYFGGVVEDKISLYQNRLGNTNMYGFGVEPSSLYYKSPTFHRWYSGGNADGGASDVMQLSATQLILGVDVGIGTSSPDYKLDVNGAIRAKEFFVETGWADYVFEDDYQLLSLVEVKSYIEEHGHLPGVPSASEVQKQGLEMGEAQTLMMQKIEELTLYMLQLSDENARLSKELAELRSQVSN